MTQAESFHVKGFDQRYPRGMPRPRSERQAWEDAGAELPAQITALEHDLDATPIEHTPRRDRLTWTIRRAQNRIAELDARLKAPEVAQP